jgi:hypothetical protein
VVVMRKKETSKLGDFLSDQLTGPTPALALASSHGQISIILNSLLPSFDNHEQAWTPNMASHFAAAKRFTPAKLRTLFVKVKPAPANLTERRAVLRVLRQYTDIDVFKKLYVSPIRAQFPLAVLTPSLYLGSFLLHLGCNKPLVCSLHNREKPIPVRLQSPARP